MVTPEEYGKITIHSPTCRFIGLRNYGKTNIYNLLNMIMIQRKIRREKWGIIMAHF